MVGAFNRQDKFCLFDVGDLVLTIKRPIAINRKTQRKFESKWEGPYVVTKVISKGAHELSNHNGQIVYACVNGKFVKKILYLKFLDSWIVLNYSRIDPSKGVT